jgi:hypothetical protein
MSGITSRSGWNCAANSVKETDPGSNQPEFETPVAQALLPGTLACRAGTHPVPCRPPQDEPDESGESARSPVNLTASGFVEKGTSGAVVPSGLKLRNC